MALRTQKTKFGKRHFLLTFWAVVAVLFGVKKAFPDVTGNSILHRLHDEEVMPKAAFKDSITLASERADSLFFAPRGPLRLTDRSGKAVKNRVVSVPSFAEAFPDLNDVQLATAQRLGISEIADRDEAVHRVRDLVYIGDNPYYTVKPLGYSIPYLVPRAATLLTEISRSFLDSLACKGIPFHKIMVTSVLRTRDDVSRLRMHNGNASEQSCHQYGTTFDISYNHYTRVQDPDDPKQVETWAVTLKSVLAEVLADQRAAGTCYVKYEVHQSCFHITVR